MAAVALAIAGGHLALPARAIADTTAPAIVATVFMTVALAAAGALPPDGSPILGLALRIGVGAPPMASDISPSDISGGPPVPSRLGRFSLDAVPSRDRPE